MGVTGLWTVVQPCARPIKIETLNRKRLAVDASIWIYQFLKAVRDKEGNALRNSHVVGFFRRICKLLFIGIKPVFVFDGGAPVLKRQTVSSRRARREGRRDDAVRTAGKLLAVQMHRRAEEEARQPVNAAQEEEVPDNAVYVDELQMNAQERQQNLRFKKKDAYHLPNLDVDLSSLGAPNDPRIMSHEELEDYARQFHTGEDVNVYDFSKIDFESPFFQSLPASDRYNILNAARLRSRLRMGYSKEQLDTMFPNRMDFSRFQIERVKERNDLTQRLMNINGMNGEDAMLNNGSRVAGEKGKEYVLVKNDGVEGGWALGVVSNKNEGQRNQPIDVEQLDRPKSEPPEDQEEDGFEDVPIEGLNRLPKTLESEDVVKKRLAVYQTRQGADKSEDQSDGLFLDQVDDKADEDVEFEDVPQQEEDDELQRAIAMSLQTDDDTDLPTFTASAKSGPRIDQPLEFNAKNAKAGRDFAKLANARAQTSARRPFENDSDDDTTLAPQRAPAVSSEHTAAQFQGPLPFESLNLGRSVLGRKKKQAEEPAGGFEKDEEKAPQPLPPWFSGDIRKDVAEQKVLEERTRQEDRRRRQEHANEQTVPILHRQETGHVIDLDEDNSDVISVNSDVHSPQPSIHDQAPENVELSPMLDQIPTEDLGSIAEVNPDTDIAQDFGAVAKSTNDEVEWTEDVAERTKYDPKRGQDGAERTKDGALPVVRDISESTDRPAIQAPADTDVVDSNKEKPTNADVAEEIDTNDEAAAEGEIAWSESDGEAQSPKNKSSTPQFPTLLELDEEDEDSDPEEADLMRQMAVEAEEHARFASSLNVKSQLESAEEYEKELRQLRNQQKKDRRDADEVTHIMVTECQQLLRLFGLPYVTAPMEAEAQCAELVNLGLVDGIVTDDSDVFLFGGTRVYKNMFNQAKFVECYLSADLEKEYSLTRPKLIQFAHLLGSDYTEGLPSVGPVTALEILSEFDNLDDFATWWSTVQSNPSVPTEDRSNAFRRKFRKNATKLFLPTTFPDKRVDLAYLHPEVDKDPESFQWGVPDLDALRSYLMATIGWTQERTDEVLVPVIRDMNRRETEGTQANITHFMSGSVGSGARYQGAENGRRQGEGKSKRMQNALGKLHHKARPEEAEPTQPARKRRRSSSHD